MVLEHRDHARNERDRLEAAKIDGAGVRRGFLFWIEIRRTLWLIAHSYARGLWE
jgi:hypothetical protein